MPGNLSLQWRRLGWVLSLWAPLLRRVGLVLLWLPLWVLCSRAAISQEDSVRGVFPYHSFRRRLVSRSDQWGLDYSCPLCQRLRLQVPVAARLAVQALRRQRRRCQVTLGCTFLRCRWP